MRNTSDSPIRDYRVIAAWAILSLQIIGLLALLLFGQDQLAAMFGDDSAQTGEVAELAESTAAPPAATATAEPATTAPEATATVSAAGDGETAPNDAPPASEADVIGPESVLIESSAVAPEWLATLVQGTAAKENGLPPHLLLTFVDPDGGRTPPADPNAIDLTRPQARIIPLAALLALLEQRGDDAGARAIEELLLLLERRPAPEEAAIPVPPLLSGTVQNFVSQADYKTFGGGNGIGYLTNITGDNPLPVTNDGGLTYIYQGVTADGRQYVFVAWPVDASFLPEGQADAVYESEMLELDRANYYATLQEQVENAAAPDLSPAIPVLSELVSSLSIEGIVAEPEEAVIRATGFDAVGFSWNWTGSTLAGGEETAVENPQDYSLALWPDGTYSIKADCNTGGGTYTYDAEGGITFNPGPLTRALCPEGSRESEFVESLPAARSISFDESGDMILETADGGQMVFANVGEAEASDAPDEAVAQPAPAGDPLNIVWQWVTFTPVDGTATAVDAPESFHLILNDDGTYAFRADCNNGAGTYVLDGATLTLGPAAATLAACGDDSLSDEFIAGLVRVAMLHFDEQDNLILTLDDGMIMTFADGGSSEGAGAAPAAQTQPAADPLAGTSWQWTHFRDTKQDFDVSGTYTITFNADGTAAVVADCNTGSGTYEVFGGAGLSISIRAVTAAACPPGSLGQAFVENLNFAGLFAVNGNVLTIELMADGGTMTLVASP